MEENLSIQKPKDGTGDLFHRRYFAILKHPKHSIEELMEVLKKDINSFSPQILAQFKKVKGETEKLVVGDEFEITLTGPWNAPVRVSQVDSRRFRFATLEGHPEAGEIEFRLEDLGNDELKFEIESVARSKDSIVNLLYDSIPVIRMAQTTMWVCFCEAFVRHATGDLAEKIGVITERFDTETDKWIQE